jgi:hypothetical protein
MLVVLTRHEDIEVHAGTLKIAITHFVDLGRLNPCEISYWESVLQHICLAVEFSCFALFSI